jgi:hypothetical protein
VGKPRNPDAPKGKGFHKSSKGIAQDTEDGSVMWLKDLLPYRVENARIGSYSYRSECFKVGKGVKTSLRECGQQLLNCLEMERFATNVCHFLTSSYAHVKQSLLTRISGEKKAYNIHRALDGRSRGETSKFPSYAGLCNRN